MFRLLVTGGRDLPEAETVWVPLWILLHREKSLIITHGKNRKGADSYVEQWFAMPDQPFNRRARRYEPAEEFLAIEDPMPAEWSRYGKVAGNIRNEDMVKKDPDVCYAFPTPDSRGTLDCMARCWVRGVPVVVWHHLTLGSYRLLGDEEGERLARLRLGWGR